MIKLINRDLKYIFSKAKKLFLIYFLLIGLSQSYILTDSSKLPIELFIELVADVGYIESMDGFVPAFFWFLFQLVPVFLVLYATYSDHVENSSYLMVKTKSRGRYFSSKFVSGFIMILLINLVLFIIIGGETWIFKSYDKEVFEIFIRLISSYIITEFIMFAISFVIAINFGYKFGVATTMFFLIISMTTNFKYFLGQQSLIMKQDVVGGYISISDNIKAWIIYLIIAIVSSFLTFRNYDFYGGSND